MRVKRVTTTEAALEALAELGEAAQPLAGGTDIMVQLARREISPEVLVPIHELEDLAAVKLNGGAEVGSLVTHETLSRGLLGADYTSIAESAKTVGSWQTQTVGTLGGNICNASPAADTVPALLVHDAEVHLRSQSGSRSMPLVEFIRGRRTTARKPDELLMSVSLAPVAPNSGDVYLKVGRRGAMEVAIVGYAMRLVFSDDGTVSDARVALASVAASPVQARAAESVLEGRRPDDALVAEVAQAVLDEISPIDDLRASARYRRLLIPGLTRRAVVRCAERAGADIDLEEGHP